MPALRIVASIAFIISLGAAGSSGQTPEHGKDFVVRISEMDTDIAVFEVFLPESQARRRGVLHRVVDMADQSEVATQKFGTADGHYKVSLIGTYAEGREYELVIDGTYRYKFVCRPIRTGPTS